MLTTSFTPAKLTKDQQKVAEDAEKAIFVQCKPIFQRLKKQGIEVEELAFILKERGES